MSKLIARMLGGADTQFSRQDFKVACQFNTGGAGPSMNYDGYAHYRNMGIRLLWNYYDTSSRINPAGGTSGLNYLATNTYVWPSGFGNHAQIWPIMDMLYVNCEIASLPFGVNDAEDTTCTAGNGGVSGTTITVSGGTTSGIYNGAILTGTGIASDTYVTGWANPTITMNKANAVANGTTVTVSGRITDMENLYTAVRPALVTELAGNPGVDKPLGMYNDAAAGVKAIPSYLYWNFYPSDISSIISDNTACGQYVAPQHDFLLPECYTAHMDRIAAHSQFAGTEKERLGITTPMFMLMWPETPAVHTYDQATAYLEYMIRDPNVDGVAFWMVSGSHLPAAAPTWYDDGTFPWITALQDFVDRYGLSL